jgi:hypothetical protein
MAIRLVTSAADVSLRRSRPAARRLTCFSAEDEEMLRYAFLRSDFHPQILILGEREDLRALAVALRTFASGMSDGQPLARQRPTAPDTATTLILVRESPPRGARIHDADQTRFGWSLDDDTALHYAELVDSLARGTDSAGSTTLETGAAGEIPVKVSLGEFTDDFLVGSS